MEEWITYCRMTSLELNLSNFNKYEIVDILESIFIEEFENLHVHDYPPLKFKLPWTANFGTMDSIGTDRLNRWVARLNETIIKEKLIAYNNNNNNN